MEHCGILNRVGNIESTKTDAADAELLAEYSWRFEDVLHLHTPKQRHVEQLRHLCRERKFLVRKRAAVKQKRTEASYQHHLPESIPEMWQQMIEQFSEHIERIEAEINALIASNRYLKKMAQIVRSVLQNDGVKAFTYLWLLTIGLVIITPNREYEVERYLEVFLLIGGLHPREPVEVYIAPGENDTGIDTCDINCSLKNSSQRNGR